MNRYTFITLIALVVFIIALPVYALQEDARMQSVQGVYRQQAVVEGAQIYTNHCRLCHGDDGQGVGAMPGLDNLAL